MVRSSGTVPVASTWSDRYWSRLLAARSSNRDRSRSLVTASSGSIDVSSRIASPIARPTSTGRPRASPCQKAIRPGSPGAGVTITCEGVMSATRHEVAPSTKTSPGRIS